MQKLKVIMVVLVFFAACADADHNDNESEKTDDNNTEGVIIINGVERSELALTMRQMYDEMKLVRDSLAAGQKVRGNYLERYKSIHTDHATEPEKIDETYQVMAGLFLKNYAQFENQDTGRVAAFNAMLDGCLACHQHKCPGPIKAINKLKLN